MAGQVGHEKYKKVGKKLPDSTALFNVSIAKILPSYQQTCIFLRRIITYQWNRNHCKRVPQEKSIWKILQLLKVIICLITALELPATTNIYWADWNALTREYDCKSNRNFDFLKRVKGKNTKLRLFTAILV